MNAERLLIHLSKYGYSERLGNLFSTKKNMYFLDTGTGKVAQIDNP